MDDIDDMIQTVVTSQWEATQRGVMSMWTIYDRPEDWPDGYIARRYETSEGETVLTDNKLAAGPEALTLMRFVFQEAGLRFAPRNPNDRPEVVEVWM